MAKQVLDLYALFRLVTAKGGLVEVINRKVWREVTRGLSLPTTITSAAFTLRTHGRGVGLRQGGRVPGGTGPSLPHTHRPLSAPRYMKYLYPYECETRALSSPGELQAAIDSNRREGRRHAYTATPLFGLAGLPPRGAQATASSPGPVQAHACAQLSPCPIKKEDSGIPAPRLALPVGLALGPTREKLAPEEPPEKRAVLMGPMDPPRSGMPPSFLPRGKVPLREERLDGPLNLAGSGISSINMALEINGVVYTGVLFARRQPVPASQGPTNPAPPPSTGPPSSTLP
ncbi:AT-rich interactive domain-containing protein 3C [Saguinus oedipus]|uniref:AT-rich interactive domain-containing protein 3 n=1 Tax=Saguinus oedipus TaxID=9490 RepID=A0ABQ9WF38_SAGOE|nr:AT-rich interactive domain-containing protein 3C [Saguinus oedipus]